MEKIIGNIKGSWTHIPYTWKHWLAFLETEKKLLGYRSHWFHDWDKLFMYVFLPFLGEEWISNFHRQVQPHHPTYQEDGVLYGKCPIEVDWVEAVIDWECAKLTKPDKPFNARQTMEKYYPEYKEYVEPILKELGL